MAKATQSSARRTGQRSSHRGCRGQTRLRNGLQRVRTEHVRGRSRKPGVLLSHGWVLSGRPSRACGLRTREVVPPTPRHRGPGDTGDRGHARWVSGRSISKGPSLRASPGRPETGPSVPAPDSPRLTGASRGSATCSVRRVSALPPSRPRPRKRLPHGNGGRTCIPRPGGGGQEPRRPRASAGVPGGSRPLDAVL